MDKWIYILDMALSYGITGYIMFRFMSEVYDRKYKEKFKYFISFLLFVIIAIGLNILGIPILKITFLLLSLCLVSYSLFIFDKKWMLIYDFVFALYIIFSDVISVVIVSLIMDTTIEGVEESFNFLFLSGICNQIILLCGFYIFVSIFKKNELNTLKIVQNIFLMLLAVFEISVLYYFYITIQQSSSGIALAYICFGFIGLDIYLVYLFEAISKRYQLERDMDLKEQQVMMQNTYYKSIEAQYDYSRRLIHDMKNHMQTFEELYANDNGDMAHSYARTIYRKMDELGSRFKCSNRFLTIIINNKLIKCDENSIDVMLEVEDIDIGFMDFFDVTTIFSNLLDNAIDACLELPIDKRHISLRIFKFNDFITVVICNSYNGKVNNKNNELKSTKQGEHMGVGLKNVKTAIEKYNGTIQYKIEEEFKVKILISAS